MFDRIIIQWSINVERESRQAARRNEPQQISAAVRWTTKCYKIHQKIAVFFLSSKSLRVRSDVPRTSWPRVLAEIFLRMNVINHTKFPVKVTKFRNPWPLKPVTGRSGGQGWSGHTPIRSVNGTCPQMLVRPPRRLCFHLWLSVNRIYSKTSEQVIFMKFGWT